MVRVIQILGLVVVLLGCVVLMGGLRPLYRHESYLLTGVSVMIVEIASALVFAPGLVKAGAAATDSASRIVHIVRMVIFSLVFVMPPTIAILFADQVLDRSRGVTETLPVTSMYSDSHRGSTTYYAVVTASMPPLRLFAFFGTHSDIVLPRAAWQTLVPGRSRLTLTLHRGRFGLPWYDVVGTTI